MFDISGKFDFTKVRVIYSSQDPKDYEEKAQVVTGSLQFIVDNNELGIVNKKIILLRRLKIQP